MAPPLWLDGVAGVLALGIAFALFRSFSSGKDAGKKAEKKIESLDKQVEKVERQEERSERAVAEKTGKLVQEDKAAKVAGVEVVKEAEKLQRLRQDGAGEQEVAAQEQRVEEAVRTLGEEEEEVKKVLEEIKKLQENAAEMTEDEKHLLMQKTAQIKNELDRLGKEIGKEQDKEKRKALERKHVDLQRIIVADALMISSDKDMADKFSEALEKEASITEKLSDVDRKTHQIIAGLDNHVRSGNDETKVGWVYYAIRELLDEVYWIEAGNRKFIELQMQLSSLDKQHEHYYARARAAVKEWEEKYRWKDTEGNYKIVRRA